MAAAGCSSAIRLRNSAASADSNFSDDDTYSALRLDSQLTEPGYDITGTAYEGTMHPDCGDLSLGNLQITGSRTKPDPSSSQSGNWYGDKQVGCAHFNSIVL